MISKTVEKMRVDLSRYGINDVREVVYNPSYETLFSEETDSRLEGYERGQLWAALPAAAPRTSTS